MNRKKNTKTKNKIDKNKKSQNNLTQVHTC